MRAEISFGAVRVRLSALISFAAVALLNPPEYAGAMAACALIHEAGHVAAIKAAGMKLESLTVVPFGAEIKPGGRLGSYREDVMIYSAGAAANLLGAAAAYTAYLFLPARELLFLIFANLFYAAFNMFPIRGLDGGGAAEALLLMKRDPAQAWRICSKISAASFFVLFIASLWIIRISGCNLSLIFALVCILAGLNK